MRHKQVANYSLVIAAILYSSIAGANEPCVNQAQADVQRLETEVAAIQSHLVTYTLPTGSIWEGDYRNDQSSPVLYVYSDRVELGINPNHCWLDRAGEPSICTRMGLVLSPVNLVPQTAYVPQGVYIYRVEGTDMEIVHDTRGPNGGIVRLTKVKVEGNIVQVLESTRLIRSAEALHEFEYSDW